MFTGWLTRGIIGLAAAVMAPVALACENPDNFQVAFRRAPPPSMERGEVVLQLDISSRVTVEEPPTIDKFGDDEIYFPNLFGVYNVKRVVSGHYDASQVKIRYGVTSCWMLGFEGADLIVGQPEVDNDGVAYFGIHHQSYPEAVAEFPESDEAAN